MTEFLKELALRIADKTDLRQLIGAALFEFISLVALPEKAILYIKGMDYAIGYIGIFAMGFFAIALIDKYIERKKLKRYAKNLTKSEKEFLEQFKKENSQNLLYSEPQTAIMLAKKIILPIPESEVKIMVGTRGVCYINPIFAKFYKV